MKGRRPRRDPNATLYVVKVALAEQKTVWRRIAIRSDQTLEDLHSAIFQAFDRFDEHLYSFYLTPPGARGRVALRDAVEYACQFMFEESDPWGDAPAHDAGVTAIGSLGLTTGRTLRYLFDFGDDWWHDITIEQTDGRPGRAKYPHLTEKHGASPPQYPEPEDDEEL
ncbi:MAG: plasmid pRiA4b ORF-3 family protein [Chloroflexi bacterium]|nr:plasmid pRiA4b ORF-3 family protein [Chloroflexota bacterium]